MNCQEFWNSFTRPPGTEYDLNAGHRAHLAACASCAAHLVRQQELARGLRLVAESDSGLRPPARVETRLLHAFRAQHGLVMRKERKGWLVPLSWAAAAALLLAVGLLLSITHQPVAASVAPQAAELAVADSDLAVPDSEDFIPLPSADSISPNDDVNMVRMEVPRSAMMALGFSVSADRASEPVEADVLLGSDGLARAVRFLD
jgi:hypothetical protein